MASPRSFIDRRSQPRYQLEQAASVVSSASNGKKPIECRISDISESGLSIELSDTIPHEGTVNVSISLPIVDQPLQIIGRVVWARQQNPTGSIYGITISDTLLNKELFSEFLSALTKLKHPVDRRKEKLEKHEYPLKNRQFDYEVLSYQSPYIHFFEALKNEAAKGQIDTIVLSDSLAYLQKRIRRAVSDYPRITLASDLKRRAHGHIVAILNLDCRRKHEPFALLDFDEFRVKTRGVMEPLFTLSRISENVDENERVNFISLGAIRNQKFAEKYLQIARFENIKWEGERKYTATKRPLLCQQINGGGLILKEVQGQTDIQRIQDFSIQFYSAGYNFRREIDQVFSEYSHFYSIVKVDTDEIVTCARVTLHLPGLHLPCMLAAKEGTEDHIQLQDPDNLSYGEIYAPYFSSISALKAYGELVRRFIYYTEEKFVDVFLTTYNIERSAESRFLTRYLGFKETNVVLKYGDFGGLWNLIYLTQNNLDKNIQINFASPEKSPRFVNTFRNH